MNETNFMIVAAALLIAAVMIPVPAGMRGILFVVLIAIALLIGIGTGLNNIGSWYR